MEKKQQEILFDEWQRSEDLAEEMVSLVGKIYRQHGVVIAIYGRALINQTLMYVLDAHRKVERFSSEGLAIQKTHRF